MQNDLDVLAQTLASRLKAIARMVSRLDRLEAGTGGWLPGQSEADLEAAAQGMILRALRVAADEHNFVLLAFISGDESRSVASVEKIGSMNRMLLSERLNDLVQVGLITREIDTDHVQATGAGRAMANIVAALRADTARYLADYLKTEGGRLGGR